MVNPCCCIQLKHGPQVFAAFDVVFNVLMIIYHGLILDKAIKIEHDGAVETLTRDEQFRIIIMCVVLIISYLLQICLDIFLRSAARDACKRYDADTKNRKKSARLHLWLLFTLVLCVVALANVILNFSLSLNVLSLPFGIFVVINKVYGMWVILTFVYYFC